MTKKTAYAVHEVRYRNGLMKTRIVQRLFDEDRRDGERVQYTNDWDDNGYIWEESRFYFKTHRAARQYVAKMYY